MSRHFTYPTLAALREDIAAHGYDIPLEDELDAVFRPVRVGLRTAGNALGIHPMEGCDGTLDGRPGELTFRRWIRFAEGGAKLVWGEATAVVPEGLANPRQLLLSRDTLDDFRRLVDATRTAHRRAWGTDDDLLLGIQLTHSGRYSHRRPVLAHHHPVLDPITIADAATRRTVDAGYPLITDDELRALEDRYAAAAVLARDAGFDFADVKQCHAYLLNELLAARTRGGVYGGSFENRTRFVRNVLDRMRDAAGPALMLASRISAFDGIPFAADPATGIGAAQAVPLPYEFGFGVDPMHPEREDLHETLALVRLIVDHGVELVNVSLGSPYWNAHIGRPYERPNDGGYASPEHPLAGVDRHFRITAAIQRSMPDLAVVGTGYSWLQRFLINAAEGNIRRGRVTIAAVGRGALAYPDFVRDARETGALNRSRVCLAVSFCTDLMRAKNNDLGQYPTGCVPRDALYADIYREARRSAQDGDASPAATPGDPRNISM